MSESQAPANAPVKGGSDKFLNIERQLYNRGTQSAREAYQAKTNINLPKSKSK